MDQVFRGFSKLTLPGVLCDFHVVSKAYFCCYASSWFGQEYKRNVLVMELLGPNLLDMLKYCDGRFSMKTACMLAVQVWWIEHLEGNLYLIYLFQIFEALDWMHRCGIVHRDIRPQNICLGHGPAARQVMIEAPKPSQICNHEHGFFVAVLVPVSCSCDVKVAINFV